MNTVTFLPFTYATNQLPIKQPILNNPSLSVPVKATSPRIGSEEAVTYTALEYVVRELFWRSVLTGAAVAVVANQAIEWGKAQLAPKKNNPVPVAHSPQRRSGTDWAAQLLTHARALSTSEKLAEKVLESLGAGLGHVKTGDYYGSIGNNTKAREEWAKALDKLNGLSAGMPPNLAAVTELSVLKAMKGLATTKTTLSTTVEERTWFQKLVRKPIASRTTVIDVPMSSSEKDGLEQQVLKVVRQIVNATQVIGLSEGGNGELANFHHLLNGGEIYNYPGILLKYLRYPKGLTDIHEDNRLAKYNLGLTGNNQSYMFTNNNLLLLKIKTITSYSLKGFQELFQAGETRSFSIGPDPNNIGFVTEFNPSSVEAELLDITKSLKLKFPSEHDTSVRFFLTDDDYAFIDSIRDHTYYMHAYPASPHAAEIAKQLSVPHKTYYCDNNKNKGKGSFFTKSDGSRRSMFGEKPKNS